MKRIISASYKDDTPAFQSEAFFESVKKGYITLDTKYGKARIGLTREDVYCFVFWTKNPSEHFLRNVGSLQTPWYLQWTITPYGQEIEPNVPSKDQLIKHFIDFVKTFGQGRAIWRYDPILINETYTPVRHVQLFEQFATQLAPYTPHVVISFLDEYGKIAGAVKDNKLRAPSAEEVDKIAAGIGQVAIRLGLKVQTCAEGKYDLTRYGIHEGPCVDADYIENRFGIEIPANIKTPGSFRRCQCAINTDIGQYHRCKHDCLYCYAK